MAKNKQVRSMSMVGVAQQVVEKAVVDKFSAIEELAQVTKPIKAKSDASGRINPQLSCTIEPQDQELLNSLSLYLSNKKGKLLNVSTVVRALIRLGNKHKDSLEV